jgi:hypothetical protein
MEALPKSSGATSQVVIGTEIKLIIAETPGPIEKAINLFKKSLAVSAKNKASDAFSKINTLFILSY